MASVSPTSLLGMSFAFRGKRAAGGKKVSNPRHLVGNSSSRHFRPGVPRAVASAKDSSPPLVPKSSTPAPFIKSNNVITATAGPLLMHSSKLHARRLVFVSSHPLPAAPRARETVPRQERCPRWRKRFSY